MIVFDVFDFKEIVKDDYVSIINNNFCSDQHLHQYLFLFYLQFTNYLISINSFIILNQMQLLSSKSFKIHIKYGPKVRQCLLSYILAYKQNNIVNETLS